jgi:hypothetical protein
MTSEFRNKTRLYKVYHIHIKGNNNVAEGYVGVTRRSLAYRLSQHRCSTRPIGYILRNLDKDAVEITQLAMLPKEEAFAMEYKLRPELNIGWNMRAGGNRATLRCSKCGKPMPHKPKKTTLCWNCYVEELHLGHIKHNSEGKGEHYRLISPTGDVYEPEAFTIFCREHSLNPQNLRKVAQGKRHHSSGWIAEKIAS